MLSIIPGKKVSQLDQAHIQREGISGLELMESAANAFVSWFIDKFKSPEVPIYIFCGPGNNGGDGIAIARLLYQMGYQISIIKFEHLSNCSSNFQANFNRLPKTIPIMDFDTFEFILPEKTFVIDAVLGVGLDRPLSGIYLDLILKLNGLSATKIAIDIPSGIPSDGVLVGDAFHADYSVTFQFPKLAMLFPEHALYTGEIIIVDIGISDGLLNQFGEDKFFIQKKDLAIRHKFFHKFSHKGDFGRVLLIGGSPGKVGAILMASRAALRTGSGLVHCHLPGSESSSSLVVAAEIMAVADSELEMLDNFDAIGVGPGWGIQNDFSFFESLLNRFRKPVVIDADGLNTLALYPHLLKLLPLQSILTPHFKEFERLVGDCSNHLERLEKARSFSRKNNCILILKGAFTSISLPNGKQFFNSTGNQYMATAGSGDVLTGIITSFLGQGYSSENAAICGVYHHGLAGELASVSKKRGMIASDIIEAIPETFVQMQIF
ncbi:hypothetical protein P872_19370 [Rhodonellum psychrophilum GCM71 = DSM 17998]|uniref:Bifunctional NAD(P)H-hydrate repair enzyme n=2 Tax=Rhodonellum TaxID=336827 RepID=U5BV47_9BACT|nr:MULTISPECIES: NAD(P)H-hydrate dehydratase [Rhodonellum]ERM81748.1 hypothetical protein P872_19370 [Rhodonellum psychrophilum GCM71 = DSM 17998]SDZ55983.1 NAD(P)H-hydrate epimerase [Rhodonellum ikkaensis]